MDKLNLTNYKTIPHYYVDLHDEMRGMCVKFHDFNTYTVDAGYGVIEYTESSNNIPSKEDILKAMVSDFLVGKELQENIDYLDTKPKNHNLYKIDDVFRWDGGLNLFYTNYDQFKYEEDDYDKIKEERLNFVFYSELQAFNDFCCEFGYIDKYKLDNAFLTGDKESINNMILCGGHTPDFKYYKQAFTLNYKYCEIKKAFRTFQTLLLRYKKLKNNEDFLKLVDKYKNDI